LATISINGEDCLATISINGEDCLATISINGYQMLGAHNNVRQCKTV
jgi:hypothetical protein